LSRGLIAAAVGLLAATGTVLAVTTGGRSEESAPPSRGAATDGWRALAPATLQRTEVAAARIGRHVYVVGGFERQSGLTSDALERYDIRTNRWRRLRSMPTGLNHATAAAHRGKLYVHGGYTARRNLTSATRRLFAYDPRRDRWQRLASSRVPRAAHALAVLGGKLYAAGGKNDRGGLRSLEVYDFGRRRWSAGPRLKGPARDHMTGVAAGGFFYALAGRDGGRNFTVAERYSPSRRRWSLLPSMRKARGGIASAAVSRGRVVVFGGEEAQGTIAEVELFDPRSRRWLSLPAMRTPRHGLGGVSLGNRVYAIEGGPQPGFHFSDAIEYLDVR
jgi:N-acetylneuraminic acid mutarotase